MVIVEAVERGLGGTAIDYVLFTTSENCVGPKI